MTNSNRIIINTMAQYTRTIINVCLSLYSTRLILSALGQSDYGIYSIVAGVIAMMSFITNALVVTTQRFLSIYHGKNDPQKIRQIFGNSMLLHILIASILGVVLFCLGSWITHDFLNIAVERQQAAWYVYNAAVVMLMLTFITAPIRALFIARENIVYISIVDVVDGILKLLIAIGLSHIAYDHLVSYSVLMAGITLVNLLAFSIYASAKFPEFHLPRLRDWDKQFIKELSHFAGWTTYSMGCIIGRNQGIAVVLNIFYGTIVNSAYGIAQQVLGAVQFISTSILNAMNPQIMKAEGSGDRSRMVRLCEYESKYAFLLLSLVAIPLIAEMDTVLHFWLGEVPEHAVMFCRCILAASLCDQISVGLTTANQAVGKIRMYNLTFYTFKLLVIVFAWGCIKAGLPLVSVMWCYIGVELFTSFLRLPLMKRIANIAILPFCRNVFLKIIVPATTMSIVCYISICYINLSWRIILTILLSAATGLLSIWITSLEKEEKQHITQLIKKIHN
ncbi:MAG: lipopolysaccharide biosynthesis protein [Paludibacteraceae bacterium]|nr:lipopolysaccharide biosynthesis protein [Paludibacteraceae bacterium]